MEPVVKVLLKTYDADTKQDMAQFIHQATVRREIVVKHILLMKRLGHRAYRHVKETQVKQRAQVLPAGRSGSHGI